MKHPAVLHIVHCVDAEGPLYESVAAKFERLKDIFGVTEIEPTDENFRKLCRGEMDLGGKETLIRQTFSPHLTSFMEDWNQLDDMIRVVFSEDYRRSVLDSFGSAYVLNWFCVDHVDYEVNPRRRALGYHVIFDYYRKKIDEAGQSRDGIHWHFHPMSVYREAHRSATSLLNSPHIITTLARRIIERRWFPSCVRSGFQTERPDIHWFLEQYIPFDFSNTSLEDPDETDWPPDMAGGRFGDWRLAPRHWGVYHPSHDHYQVQGACRRWIARSLNVFNRFANLTENEVVKAFEQARSGEPTLLGIASHDFRDLRVEIDHVRELLISIGRRYPDVPFRFCEARDAFRSVACGPPAEPLRLCLSVSRDDRGLPREVRIETGRGEVFGPQPFLALRTKFDRFLNDNLIFSTDLKSWKYVFDAETVLPEDVASVGVGANDRYGNTCVAVIDMDGDTERKEVTGV